MPIYGFSFRPVRREHRVEGLALPLLVLSVKIAKRCIIALVKNLEKV